MASDTDVPRGRAATRRVGILLSGLLLSCLTGYATFRAATLVPQHQAEPTLSIAAGVLLALGIRYVVRRPAVISRRRMQLELATVFALMIAVPLPGHTGLPPWLELGCDAYLLAWAGSFIVEQITHRGGCVRLPAPSP